METNQAPQNPRVTQIARMLLFLVALTLVMRLPGIARPLVGNFATKNVTYAMIARNWAEGRTTLWYPRFDCLAGQERTLYLQEFPVSAYLTAALWKCFGGALDVWGRATSIALTSAAVVLLYLWMLRRHGQGVAAGAAFALALSPVSIAYGQSFIIQASLVCFTLMLFLAWDRWLDEARWPWLGLAAGMGTLVLLTKIYMLVLGLPLAAMAWRAGLNRRQALLASGAIGVALVPVLAWYAHVVHVSYALGLDSPRIEYSLVTIAGAHRPPHPLLFTFDFYRQVLDDLATVVLTPVGFALPILALWDRRWRNYLPWLLAMAVLLLAIPRKFYELNYYYFGLLPPLCILIGLGWNQILQHLKPNRGAMLAFCCLATLVSLRYSVRPAFVTPEEDRGVVAAAASARELIAPEQPVATMHGSSIDLLYYCDRPGWAVPPNTPNLQDTLNRLAGAGAKYLVVAGPVADAIRRSRQEDQPAATALSVDRTPLSPLREERLQRPPRERKDPFIPDQYSTVCAPLSCYPMVDSGNGFCLLRIGEASCAERGVARSVGSDPAR